MCNIFAEIMWLSAPYHHLTAKQQSHSQSLVSIPPINHPTEPIKSTHNQTMHLHRPRHTKIFSISTNQRTLQLSNMYISFVVRFRIALLLLLVHISISRLCVRRILYEHLENAYKQTSSVPSKNSLDFY